MELGVISEFGIKLKTHGKLWDTLKRLLVFDCLSDQDLGIELARLYFGICGLKDD